MKAILKFNLENNSDRQAYEQVANAQKMAMALWRIRHNARKEIQNYLEINSDGSSCDISAILDIVFYRLNNIIADDNLNIDELID